MKFRWYTIAMVLLLGSFSAGAQRVDKKLDDLRKDPKTEENRARADVYRMGKKIMPDSLQQPVQQQAASTGRKQNKKCQKHP